jgi:hypothetical protein
VLLFTGRGSAAPRALFSGACQRLKISGVHGQARRRPGNGVIGTCTADQLAVYGKRSASLAGLNSGLPGYVSLEGLVVTGGGWLMVESDKGERSRRRAADPAWRKSSFCASGECVEVSQQDGLVVLRNSKNPDVVLRCTSEEWRSFVAGIKAGECGDLGERPASGPGPG